MKSKIFLIITLILMLTLGACGGGDKPAADVAKEVDEFVFEAEDGYNITVDMDMDPVFERLGEPVKYYGADSCAFDGQDKVYTYASFVITTRPEADRDLISCITLTDDSVSTPEGAYIGCSKAQVEELYGKGEEHMGGVKYHKGNCTLHFIISQDKVISIEYLSKNL